MSMPTCASMLARKMCRPVPRAGQTTVFPPRSRILWTRSCQGQPTQEPPPAERSRVLGPHENLPSPDAGQCDTENAGQWTLLPSHEQAQHLTLYRLQIWSLHLEISLPDTF